MPFKLTNEILEKVANIMEKIGMLDNVSYLEQTKINSIHSSLAI